MKSAIWIAMVAVAGCGGRGIQGSGKAKTDVRPVTAFTAVDIASALDAEITLGPTLRVEITGDDNLVPLVTTAVGSKGLEVRAHDQMRPALPLVVHITLPSLTAVAASGASTVILHGIRSDALTAEVRGAGKLQGDGAVHALTATVDGAGDLVLDQLAAERASIKVAGAGTAVLEVAQALDVQITGAGTVTYHGDPQVTKTISNAGSLIHR